MAYVKNIFIYLLLFLFAGFLACKKDTGPVPPAGPSKSYKTLTSHYWRLTGKWYDTTDYGKNHPELIPLATSMDEYNFIDSCFYYTSVEYNTDGNKYAVQGKWCGCQNSNPCKPLIISWALINHDQVIREGVGSSHLDYSVAILNDSILQISEFEIYNFTKTLIAVYRYQPFIYK